MANWKKIIVRGSSAALGQLNLPSLTTTQLIQVGSAGVLQDSGLTLTGNVLNIGANSITSTGASSIITGSFTGSFSGDGSGLTGVAQNIDTLDAYGAATLHQTQDHFLLSDNGTEKKISFTNLEDSIFANVSGDATIAAGGALTIAADSVQGTMLSSSVADGTTIDLSGDTLSVLKVPNALTAGSGLFTGGGTFDGSATRTFSIDSGSMMPFISSSVFGTVSGDITITAAGVATIGADTIDGSQLEDSISITSNLTVGGNLTVNGTTTAVNTTNLLVEDRFILLNSGSANPDEGGLIIDQGGLSGSAFIFDAGDDRWGFNALVSSSQATANSNAYAAQVIDENNSAHIGAVSASYVANGNIRIATNGDIFIYS